MAKCKNCKHMIYQKVVFNYTTTEYPYCPVVEECLDDIDKEIVCSGFEGITNADRIRSMTDEELAEVVSCKFVSCNKCEEQISEDGSCTNNCKNELLRWLKSEVGCD